MKGWGFPDIAKSPSRRFAAVAAAFCVGVSLAPFIADEGNARAAIEGLNVALAVSAGTVVLVRDRSLRLACVCLLLFLGGMFRYTQTLLPSDVTTVELFVGREHRVSGTVVSEPIMGAASQRIVVDHLSVDFSAVPGKLQASVPTTPEVEYGDAVSFACDIELPEPFSAEGGSASGGDGFAYDEYLRNQGILAVCSFAQNLVVAPAANPSPVALLLRVKRTIKDRLADIVPEPHASFLSGLLFGGSSGLSADLKDDFSRTGTSHILAASGFNVSLFSAVILGWILQLPISRKRAVGIIFAMLVGYVLIAGATAAVVRAGIMAGVTLVGLLVRRKPYAVNVFALAAVLLLAANPRLLWDVGFQLSFVATFAIVAIAPSWERALAFVPETLEARKALAGSLAATVLTLPIMLWHFGSVSLISPIVNLLVLPFVPLLMALTIAALLVSVISLGLGLIAALPAWAISSVLLHVIAWNASLSWASVSVGFAETLAIVSAIMIIYWLWRSQHPEGKNEA
jgi:competence protein ComEC